MASVSSIVEVIVTPQTENNRFKLHKTALCDVSPFFSNAFNGQFKESHTDTITISSTSIATFGLFTEWLYSRKLLDTTGNPTAWNWHWDVLIDLYIFADSYDVPGLREDIEDIAFSKAKRGDEDILPTTQGIRKLFDNVPHGAGLCKHFVETFAKQFDPGHLDAAELELARRLLHPDFAWAVMVYLADLRARKEG
ncbi:hypothetical protein M501DRAFT_1056089 [Patellaria atrata CBS 101060]|uniref:BTB domain-containing protein n=1 Tax=Patellaria atrata CBS 101060 TaxID=1346257 RepID=A0A9P4VTC4_9PEZI|nr:hypothetical protein M501DRAFT_1056089 [Patellaria atrata CBS 101060]